jgi:hypothetical protein
MPVTSNARQFALWRFLQGDTTDSGGVEEGLEEQEGKKQLSPELQQVR